MTALARQLKHYGLSSEALAEQAEAVILFGSRAAGLAHENSDWDILIVTSGRTRLRRGLDLVYVEPAAFRGARWRSSELAGHVGRWGRTLAGDTAWLELLEGSQISSEAIARKRRQLRAQLGACENYWSELASWAQAARGRRLRRDLQRHVRLLESEPIPPSALLDREWMQMGVKEQAESLRRWLALAELTAHDGPWLALDAAGASSIRLNAGSRIAAIPGSTG